MIAPILYTHRMSWPRRIALSLFLGVTTTIAVSWALAWRSTPIRIIHYGSTPEPPFIWHIQVYGTSHDLKLIASAYSGGPHTGEGEQGAASGDAPRPRWTTDQMSGCPAWSLARDRFPSAFHPIDARNGLDLSLYERATGWPWIAMASHKLFANDSNDLYAIGSNQPRFPMRTLVARYVPFGLSKYTIRHLPIEPVFPGFLANTSLFAAAWLALLSAVASIARRRRGHNLCPSCRYPLASLPTATCPECGHTSPPVR